MSIYNVGAYLGDRGNQYSAVSKPIADVIKIMGTMGVQDLGSIASIPDRFWGRLTSKKNLDEAFSKVRAGDVLIVQYPLYVDYPAAPQILRYLSRKGIKTVAFIHDINPLRFTKRSVKDNILRPSTRMSYAVKCLNLFTHIIYPNASMQAAMESHGVNVPANTLKFYDYLVENGAGQQESGNLSSQENYKQIFFAGNLDKSTFLEQYRSGNSEVKFVVFGQKPATYSLPASIDYRGAKSPDELPSFLKNGLGLVWDGTSPNQISGGWGEYLRYNNPYKASSYLAAGIPLVVWKDSALAEIVSENQIGILVDSLGDAEMQVSNMTLDEFNVMEQNVTDFRDKLLAGKFTVEAVGDAIQAVGV
ncbi:hypothetical protein [Lacticaseibacillus pantheris]|uniref:hypothetical protein n=1 Tax=Lacticaseibacillus pantheris TaxID=171523 RepID=UPI0026598AC1|nr:hypothetical protein [Lacticaseibacillus pantheris]WKF84754.1 hypothetical protein QY874_10800 [Lacticaseibacillus pantheris]